jgi:hypothetical protein
MKIYIYTTILIVICCTIVYILIDRKYKNSRPDTKSEIQRNLSNQLNNSAGNLLQSDPSGNLSVIPAPPVDQPNYVLTGNGNWAPPPPVEYLHVANTTSGGYPGGTPIPFETLVSPSTNSITLDSPYTLFVLKVGKTYKLMGGVNYWRTRGGVYQWRVVTGATKGYIGTGGDGNDIASSAAIAYIAPTVPTSVSLYAFQDVNLQNYEKLALCAWATIDVLG